MKKKKILFGVIILLLIAGAVAIVKIRLDQKAALAKPKEYVQAVNTAQVASGELEITKRYLARIESASRSDLSPNVSGTIREIRKREGDRVRTGEVLAVIDERELVDRAAAARSEVLATEHKLAGAKSQYETQKSIYDRDVMLFKEGAISREALERSRAAFDGVKSSVDAYQESLKGLRKNASATETRAGYARIPAPFDGVVAKRWSEPGDLAVLGKPILTVEKSSSFRIIAQVPPEEMSRIKIGATIYLRNGDQSIVAKVNRIYPALGRNLLGSIEILSPSAPFGLPSGSTLGIDVVIDKVKGMIVPANALVRTDRGSFVYTINNDLVKIKPVKVLGEESGKAAVSGELAQGDRVITGQENMLLFLKEGARVKALESNK
ncbi:MAG: efflux RND transporter periplasmic adaptor subunit [Syntrophales bacterium]